MDSEMSKSVIYDYYDTTVYMNQYEKDINNGYIKITYKNSKSIIQPNLILPNNDKYKIENIYIFKKNIIIDNINFHGELIIEHTPLTNSEKKVYVCILLKTQSNVDEETDIDKLIKKSFLNNIVINFNNHLTNTNNKCLVNKNNTVFIFEKPLLISSHFDQFSNIDNILFSFNKSDFKSINAMNANSDSNSNNNNNNIKENFETQLIECSPVDSSDETVAMIPVNSDNLNSVSSMNIVNTMQNFFIFNVLLIVIVILIPIIYKNLVWNIVDYSLARIKTVKEKEKFAYLRQVDYIIIFVLAFIFLSILIDGASEDIILQTTVGVFGILILFLSIMIMMVLKKLFAEQYDFKTDSSDEEYNDTLKDINVFYVLGTIFSFLLIKFNPLINPTKTMNYFFIFMFIEVLFIAIIFLVYNYKYNKNLFDYETYKSNSKSFWKIFSYSFIFAIFITMLLIYNFDKSQPITT